MDSKVKVGLEKHAEESARLSKSSLVADSRNGSSLETLHSMAAGSEDRKVSMNELQQSSNWTGDRSLATALEKLSLGAEETGQTWLKKHPNLMLGQFMPSLNSEASIISDPSLRSSHYLTNGYYDIQMKGLSPSLQNISAPQRPIFNVHQKEQFCYPPEFEIPSSAMPLAHEVPPKHLRFPRLSQHEQVLLSEPSPMHFMHSQQMNHDQMGSNCTKEDQFHSCRIEEQQQYQYHLHNHHPEYFNQLESFGNAAFETLRFQRSPKKQCSFEVPVSRNVEQFNPKKYEGFCNGTAHCGGGLGISDRVVSTQHVDTLDGHDKSFYLSSPRKIHTRTHGLNVVDCMKYPSVDSDKLKDYLSQYGSPYRCCCGYSSATTDCICHENLRVSPMLSSYVNRKIERQPTLPLQCNSLAEATGKIYHMAKDQHGCRFLQRMFSEGTKKDIDMIFDEILYHVSELMIDPFGNYLIQKLLGVCDEDQRFQILFQVNRPGELIRISCNTHGTRAVQKLIETLKTPEQFSMIVSLLETGIVTLMKNLNGNHVAQHCLQYLVPDYIKFLFDAATNCCFEVATDRHGCCVLQKCLSCSDIRYRDLLLREVVRNALFLSQDQYGNYVVQFALELGRYPIALPWVTISIFKRLEGHFADLSIQKYSSNVVEKCVYAEDECLTKVVDELINDQRFSLIMLNPYGNYAVQAVLNRSRICNSSLHAKLVAAIRPHIPLLRTNMYGKKVLAVLAKSN